MSKKEPNAWDRFWIYIKENEKVIWVLLLLILAPSFAFTGYFQTIGSASARKRAVINIFGKDVTAEDYEHARLDIRLVQEVAPHLLGADSRNPYFTTSQAGVTDFLIYLAEADRLGIRVSDLELGAQVRGSYQDLVAKEDAQAAMLSYLRDAQKDGKKSASPQAAQSQALQAYYTRLQELEKQDAFNEKDWYEKLQNWRSPTWNQMIPREDLESAMLEVMKARKLRDFIQGTVQVTPEEALEDFKKKEQSRKFSFFEVSAAPAREEVEKSITDADLKARYDKNKADFKDDLKIRVDYLSLPVSEFEKKVTLTDEDLRKEYDFVKMKKYQTFLGGDAGDFGLLTPEEKAEREKKAYRPFEEVKEEIREELMKQRVRETARAEADKIQEKLFPKKPGAIGEKKDEKAGPAPATFEEVAKEFPMVKTGTTPWVDRKSAEKSMAPEAWVPTVFNSWFAQLEGSPAMKTPPKKEVEAPRMASTAPSFSDPKYFVFYKKPEVRPSGVPPFEEAKVRVKEMLVKEKLFDRAREKAKAISEEIRSGKKSFEDGAKEAGAPVLTSAFVEQSGTIKVPLGPEETKKAEEEKKDTAAAESAPPKEKDLPASRAVLDFGFNAIREKGKVDGFAEDAATSTCYVVRWDDTIFPDLKQFDSRRSTHERELLTEKQAVYLADWWAKVQKEAKPSRVVYGERGPTRERETAPVDPDAE
jgi:hypothetical protein